MNIHFEHMERLRHRIKTFLRVTQLLNGKSYIYLKVFKNLKSTLITTVIYHLILHYLSY